MSTKDNFLGNLFSNLLIISIGLLFLIPPSIKLINYCSFRLNSVCTEGVVVKEGMGRFTGSKPFVEYFDNKGEFHEFKSEVNFHWFFSPKRNEKLEILYLKESTDVAIINNSFHYIILPFLMIAIGLAVLLRIIRNILVLPK